MSSSAAQRTESKVAGHAYVYSGRTGALLLTLAGERTGDQFGSTVAATPMPASSTSWSGQRVQGLNTMDGSTCTRASHALRFVIDR
jgi:hypothetical protein